LLYERSERPSRQAPRRIFGVFSLTLLRREAWESETLLRSLSPKRKRLGLSRRAPTSSRASKITKKKQNTTALKQELKINKKKRFHNKSVNINFEASGSRARSKVQFESNIRLLKGHHRGAVEKKKKKLRREISVKSGLHNANQGFRASGRGND